jgi:hypothetical protein
MFGKKQRLLEEGERGQGVVTQRRAGGMTTTHAGGGSGRHTINWFELQGHIKFPDGTQTEFRSGKLSSDKVGNIGEGKIVPVRYDASDHSKVVLDVATLEAQHTAEREQTQARLDQRKEQAIAEADARAAQANPDGPPAGS